MRVCQFGGFVSKWGLNPGPHIGVQERFPGFCRDVALCVCRWSEVVRPGFEVASRLPGLGGERRIIPKPSDWHTMKPRANNVEREQDKKLK